MTTPQSPAYIEVLALRELAWLDVGKSVVVQRTPRIDGLLAGGYLVLLNPNPANVPPVALLPVSYATFNQAIELLSSPRGTDDVADKAITLAKLADEVISRLGGGSGGSATTDASQLTSGQLSIARLSAILAAANGLATLDGNTLVPLAQLPTSVKGRAPLRQTIVASAASATTPTLADANVSVFELTNNSASTFVVPPASSVAWTTGDTLDVVQLGGQVTITAGTSAVLLQGRGGAFKTAGLYASVSLRYRGADTWLVAGDVVA